MATESNDDELILMGGLGLNPPAAALMAALIDDGGTFIAWARFLVYQ